MPIPRFIGSLVSLSDSQRFQDLREKESERKRENNTEEKRERESESLRIRTIIFTAASLITY